VVYTSNAPEPIGPYSQAVKVGSFLYLSGQIGINPANGELVQDDIETETNQVMKNIKAILEQEKLTFMHIVKSSIFLKNMSDFTRVNAVYGSYFKDIEPPARETVEVSGLPKGVQIEISVIAHF